jgi:hypothetical protein
VANPNIVQTSIIKGRTDVVGVGVTASTMADNAVSSGRVFKINCLLVSNIDGSNNVDVNVSLYRGSVDYYIAKTISVPADSTLVAIGKENPMYLVEGDSIRVVAGADGMAQAICSYEEIG